MVLFRLFVLALVVISFVSCSTASRFNTQPSGAKLFINGDFVGQTPVVYDDSYGLPARLHVEIKKEGYDDLDMYLDKGAAYRALLPSMLIPYVGFIAPLWSFSLEDVYRFNLAPLKKKPSQSSQAPAQPPTLAAQ